MKNYYEILGVTFDATQDEIKKAYRDMMKKYHPDKHTEENSEFYENKTKEINEAYEVLGNEQRRREYNIDYVLYEEREARRKERKEQEKQQRTRTYTSNRTNEETRKYRTNKQKSRKNSRQKVSDDSFFSSVRKAYKEVKSDESTNPFKIRHKNLNKKFYKKHARKVDSTGDLIAFRIGQGIVHISAEVLYQLSKLSYINKDNVVKYVLRNRRLAAAIIAGFIITSNIPSQSNNVDYTDAVYTVAGQVVDNQEDENDADFTLIRNYTVKTGDSLSSLSNMSLTRIDDIKRINNLDSDMLYVGDVIKVPYIVSKNDLQYYVQTVDTNGMSIKDLAYIYETDEETLYNLNKEAIRLVDDEKIIMSDTVLVPNFISSYDLDAKKDSKVKTY